MSYSRAKPWCAKRTCQSLSENFRVEPGAGIKHVEVVTPETGTNTYQFDREAGRAPSIVAADELARTLGSTLAEMFSEMEREARATDSG